MTSLLHRTLALLTGLALAGCVELPLLRKPAPELPTAWPAPGGEGQVAATPATAALPVPADWTTADWWTAYADPTLDQLVAEALTQNSDLRLAAARVAEARAQLGLREADRYPGVDLEASAGRSQVSERGVNPVQGSSTNNSFKASFQAAYQLDLWGRYRNASEAARADLLASEYAAGVVRASLVAAVARAYFDLAALDAQRRLALDTRGNRTEALNLLKLRLDGGIASDLEVRQAEAELAAVDIAATRLGHQVRQQELVLAGLLGREPRRLVEEGLARGAGLAALRSPPAIPAGLPADLLTRRPDLRQAEQRLLASQARIKEIRAALFPDLRLTAYLGAESKALADLFSGSAGVWGLTAGLVQSVFNAGRTESAVRAAAARQEQALADYKQTVRTAFREVLDALVAHREARERGEGEARRADALRQAAEIANLRFENGLTSHLEVLDARRNLFQAESNGIEARRAQLAASADLALALGGGWGEAGVGKP